jgi:integrase
MPAHRHPVEVVSPMLDSYLARLTLAAYRPRTITARRCCLAAFARSIQPRDLLEATRTDLEAYLSRPLRPETRRCYRAHLRAFYGWLADEELIAKDPTLRIPAIRVPRTTPRPISSEDLDRALAAGDARMRCWLLLMSLAGLRCVEVAGLRPGDLQHVEGGVLLYLREAKGGGTGVVPAHVSILEALAALPIRNGAWWTCSHGTVSAMVSEHLRACGIQATAHKLRHTAGSVWYRTSGHDLLTTAALLRHANVATTQKYAALDSTRAAEVVNAMPLRLVDPGAVG